MRRPKSVKSREIPDALPARELPAKTFVSKDGVVTLGRSVENHCVIVGYVAKELIRRLPISLSSVLFPPGSELVAACHDVGKVSPTFYLKLLSATTAFLAEDYESFRDIDPKLEKLWGGHAGVSQLAISNLSIGKYIHEIVGQHHGFSPIVNRYLADDSIFGGRDWQVEREKLVGSLKEEFQTDFPEITSDSGAKALAGLTSVADWIGSGSHFENPTHDWRPIVERAVDDAGFIFPKIKKGLSFKEIFGYSKPRDAQSLLIKNGYKPGVHIMEAPMGLGKTEAALFCAYLALSELNATGIYFALPTQLTSNAIYRRFNAFLEEIIDGVPESYLLHSAAWLVDKVEMGASARPGGSWFDSKKRGLLAPFAVGTIDQALMAAMNVRHGFVRAFGLAGKVVILDEVHSYDAYTGTILDALIDLLQSLNCTVIVLSATLTQIRRNELIKGDTNSVAYPLVCSKMAGLEPQVDGLKMNETHNVSVKLIENDDDAIEEAIARAANGQQVLWIENTVGEAQEIYRTFCFKTKGSSVELGLIHSKFTQQDRSAREEYWVGKYGLDGKQLRLGHGRILIGTQVLEQSLDIDADFLVTRLCPTDMLLQRVGRLWRHTSTPREKSAKCEAWVLAPLKSLVASEPSTAFGKSSFVYSAYVLNRSYEVLGRIKALCLPNDIRSLIESTYSERAEVDSMKSLYRDLMDGTPIRKGVKALRNFASIGLATGGQTLPEEKAQTRYSEVTEKTVLLIRALHTDPVEKSTTVTLLDGKILTVPHSRHAVSLSTLRNISSALARQMITTLTARAPDPISVAKMKSYGLAHCMYVGNDDSHHSAVSIGFVTESGRISNSNDKYESFYDNEVGYRTAKI